jgi:hypothetical protein
LEEYQLVINLKTAKAIAKTSGTVHRIKNGRLHRKRGAGSQ